MSSNELCFCVHHSWTQETKCQLLNVLGKLSLVLIAQDINWLPLSLLLLLAQKWVSNLMLHTNLWDTRAAGWHCSTHLKPQALGVVHSSRQHEFLEEIRLWVKLSRLNVLQQLIWLLAAVKTISCGFQFNNEIPVSFSVKHCGNPSQLQLPEAAQQVF